MAELPASKPLAEPAAANIRGLVPGLLLAAATAVVAYFAAPIVGRVVPIPAMVIALLIGIAFNFVAVRPTFQPGIVFCVKTVLRWAVGLLGLRIALGDIAALGVTTAVIVVASMVLTIGAGLLVARAFGQDTRVGALVGVATAVCGASAALATATVLPDYRGKQADTIFAVVAVNAIATLAMVIYPLLCVRLGFDERTTGVMLGATIHDVAQVVGAGYAVSDTVGNTAVIVKLFRVFLLLPVVLTIGWGFARTGSTTGTARVPLPVFAIAFLALCVLNSMIPAALMPIYTPIRAALIEISTWGLLIAIAALGLGTSFASIAALGWRHIATVTCTTLVILVAATSGLLLTR
jgi:uncharacterized integral membrane protein (TIGR00698 family)